MDTLQIKIIGPFKMTSGWSVESSELRIKFARLAVAALKLETRDDERLQLAVNIKKDNAIDIA